MEIETPKQLYQTAIVNFERGNYGTASRQLEQALAMVDPQTKLGGQVQLWLVNAYEATGKSEPAIALCQQLIRHTDYDVRQSANYVLGIISAPELARREDLVSKIPSLKEITEGDPGDRLSVKAEQRAKSRPKPPPPPPELDLSIPVQPSVNPNSDRFIGVITLILLVALAFLAIG
jgi:tetratricopeptide (TPR) repeat protein